MFVPTITDRIDKALIDAAGPKLKLIANFEAPRTTISTSPPPMRSGLIVTNTPDVLTDCTADMAMLLIMAAARRLVEGADLVQAGGFSGWTPTSMLGRRLRGKQLGIVGMGRIGQALGRRARAFGIEINYHNRKPVGPRIEEELSDQILGEP